MTMRIVLGLIILCSSLTAPAQTLFSYGPHKVSKDEFWKAYTRNNNAAITEASIQQYLDLYIRFKLKVQAARDLRMDTLPGITTDVAGFRAQMAEQYMTQQNHLKELVTEAAHRSETEIEAAHIFIAYGSDSAAARSKAEAAYTALKGGAPFNITSRSYSTDAYVRATDGYLGYISAFSLPYELENELYKLTPGSYSMPLRGYNGWHILQVLRKRPSLGTMQAAHILFAAPENASQEELAAIQRKADSVYQLLQQGLSFRTAAELFSNDKQTYMAGGVLPEFTYSKYDSAFSKASFSLLKDDAISTPVRTQWGWHIIRRIALRPATVDLNDATTYQRWEERVRGDARIIVLRQRQLDDIKKASGYKALSYNEAQLWQLTDSVLAAKNYTAIYRSQQQRPLFQLKDKTISVADWLRYVRNNSNSNTKNNYPRLLQQFTDETVEQYYKDRLERMNDDFRYQIQEFTEGSLLFEIMEKQIWSVAPTDSIGLQEQYNKNKDRYLWKPSISAIIFNCADTSIANRTLALMRQDPTRWETYIEQMSGYALADSGRFEYEQLPVRQPGNLQQGSFTTVEINENDGSASFCYIIKHYSGGAPRSFNEAKGMVINDYQQVLEERWLNNLRKKYPVKVETTVLQQLMQTK